MYRILFEEIDESCVDILHLSTCGDEKDTEKFRFPRAGNLIKKVVLKLFFIVQLSYLFFILQKKSYSLHIIIILNSLFNSLSVKYISKKCQKWAFLIFNFVHYKS